MRVGFLNSAWPKTSETYILNQAVGLLRAGHELQVYARRRPPDLPEHGVVKEWNLVAHAAYALDGDEPDELARAFLGSPFWRPRVAKELARSVARGKRGARRVANLHNYLRVGDGDLDAFHAHFGPVGTRWDFLATTPLLDDEPEKPFVVSFYGHDASRLLDRDPHRYDHLFRVADAVTVLSEDMRDSLEEVGCPSGKLSIQPLCIDTSLFDVALRGPPDDGPVLVATVARLVEKKGIRYGLEALARAREEVDVRYRIAGDGPLRDRLEERARELGIADAVDFLGWCDQERVRDLLGEAHIFMLPSVTSEDGDQEGTPTVLLEAQARGVPVLSTYHAGIPEVVDEGESGVLVPPGDADALSEALLDLATSPERWEPMGKRGRRYVEDRHSIPEAAARLESLYTEHASG